MKLNLLLKQQQKKPEKTLTVIQKKSNDCTHVYAFLGKKLPAPKFKIEECCF